MKNCSECHQECCNNVIVEIDEPETKEDWEEIKWQVAHDNVRVILDNEDDWCIEFVTKCKYINSDGKCRIYEKRPGVCSEHDSECCEVNGNGEYYKIIFKDINDVENYLKKNPDAIKEEREFEISICPECGCEFLDEDDED